MDQRERREAARLAVAEKRCDLICDAGAVAGGECSCAVYADAVLAVLGEGTEYEQVGWRTLNGHVLSEMPGPEWVGAVPVFVRRAGEGTPPTCPRCGSTDRAVRLATGMKESGRRGPCGHAWHSEGTPPTEPPEAIMPDSPPQVRSDDERLAALNDLRAAEGNAPSDHLPTEGTP